MVYNTTTASDLSKNFYVWSCGAWQVVFPKNRYKAVAKYNITDTSTNVNASINCPIFGIEIRNDLPTVFISSGSEVLTITEGGVYNFTVNVRLVRNSNSKPQVIAQFTVNGTERGAIAASTFIPKKNRFTSFHLNETLKLEEGDVVRFKMASIKSGNLTMIGGGNSNIIITKLR